MGSEHILSAETIRPGHRVISERHQAGRFGAYAHWDLAHAYEAAGKHEEAVREFSEMLRQLDFHELAGQMEQALAKKGYRAAYQQWASAWERLEAQGEYVPPVFVAFVYGLCAGKDHAFAWLEQAYKVHDADLTDLNSDPIWDLVRSDPRFGDLVRRVGLPQ